MENYVRSDLASAQGKVEVWAWIEKVRDQKSMQFDNPELTKKISE